MSFAPPPHNNMIPAPLATPSLRLHLAGVHALPVSPHPTEPAVWDADLPDCSPRLSCRILPLAPARLQAGPHAGVLWTVVQ